MKLQKGMFRVTFYHSVTREIFAHGGENLLLPLFPLHCRRETSKDVKISFAAQPGISRERSLGTDLGLNSSTREDILNFPLSRPRQAHHLLSFLMAWNDLLGDSLNDYLDRLGQVGLPQLMTCRNFEES